MEKFWKFAQFVMHYYKNHRKFCFRGISDGLEFVIFVQFSWNLKKIFTILRWKVWSSELAIVPLRKDLSDFLKIVSFEDSFSFPFDLGKMSLAVHHFFLIELFRQHLFNIIGMCLRPSLCISDSRLPLLSQTQAKPIVWTKQLPTEHCAHFYLWKAIVF